MRPLYFATREFGYGNGPENILEHGQVIELHGYEKDEKLVRLGYLEAKGKRLPHACRECPKVFAEERYLNIHGDRKHGLGLTSEADLAAMTKPLHLDKTAAARR